MAVYYAGFSERVFEFGFNSEYADRNRAVLAAAPHVPTQNEEKTLGYDIAFEIKRRGGAVHAVALQHKTCRFVDGAGATNSDFWNAAGGPYFAFRLDVEQFNIIESLASSGLKGIEFVYCAPLFTTWKEMGGHYLGSSVMSQSLWVNPRGCGPLVDNEPHSIIFDKAGLKAFVFSTEPKPLLVSAPRKLLGARRHDQPLDLRAVYEGVRGALSRFPSDLKRRREEDSHFRIPRELPPRIDTQDETRLTRGVAELFSDYLGMSLLLEVKRKP
jgi:hypothetical protein